nr:hypothetical protein [Tanacetum cinerariifolium]
MDKERKRSMIDKIGRTLKERRRMGRIESITNHISKLATLSTKFVTLLDLKMSSSNKKNKYAVVVKPSHKEKATKILHDEYYYEIEAEDQRIFKEKTKIEARMQRLKELLNNSMKKSQEFRIMKKASIWEAFGGYTRAWTQFGKKQDKIATLHEVALKNFMQCLETVSQFLTTPLKLATDDVKKFVMSSECNHLNETLRRFSEAKTSRFL